jgi:hypothetical protein
MGVCQIKCDLNVFVRVFRDDEAITVDVGVLPFTLEKDGATLLHFSDTQVSLFEE